MKLGVRAKLFAFSVGLVMTVILVSGFFLAHVLRENLLTRIEVELTRHAHAASMVVEASDISTISKANHVANRLSEQMGARVTIVQKDGTVVGDSQLNNGSVEKLENHGDRVEIRRAFNTGNGLVRRYSTTTMQDMLYIASSYGEGDVQGVVRVSRSLSDIDQALASLVNGLLIAGFIGLIAAILISAFMSKLFSQTLFTLVEHARAMVDGAHRPKLDVSRKDEMGGLAGSLNVLSEQLERHMGTLADERDRFEAVLDGMAEAVLVLDEENHVTLINRAGIMLLGLKGQPIGQTLIETVRIPRLNEIVSGLDDGDDAAAEFVLGEQTVLARITQRAGVGTIIVLLDVTELRHLESLRRDFVSNVSHELRTPVAIMLANAETLLDGALEDREAATGFLNSMHTNAKRLSSLIGDLLDLSRIEEGRYELEKESVSVAVSLRRAAAALETSAMDKDFSIIVDPAENAHVVADARALDQVLFNLLDNAVKYGGQGGKAVLRAVERKDHVRIEVEDNGPGIAQGHRSRLFERFFRVDPGRSKAMGGTGLGLAIVKHLVQAMGGEVGMEPVEPTGTLFWFVIPK